MSMSRLVMVVRIRRRRPRAGSVVGAVLTFVSIMRRLMHLGSRDWGWRLGERPGRRCTPCYVQFEVLMIPAGHRQHHRSDLDGRRRCHPGATVRTRSGRRAPPWDLQQYGVPTPHSDRLDASGGCDPDQRKDVAPHDRCRGPRLAGPKLGIGAKGDADPAVRSLNGASSPLAVQRPSQVPPARPPATILYASTRQLRPQSRMVPSARRRDPSTRPVVFPVGVPHRPMKIAIASSSAAGSSRRTG